MTTEWCYKDICKEIGAPKQYLPGENRMHPIDTAFMEYCPNLPALDFMSTGFLWHVIGTDLPWLAQFSLPRHSQTSSSWGFTHLLLATALPLLWAPYFISHLGLVLLECYKKLAWDILLGVFFLNCHPYFSYSSYSWIFCLSLYNSPVVVTYVLSFCSSWHLKLILYSSLTLKLSIFFQVSAEDLPFSTCLYQYSHWSFSTVLFLNCIYYMGIHSIFFKGIENKA